MVDWPSSSLCRTRACIECLGKRIVGDLLRSWQYEAKFKWSCQEAVRSDNRILHTSTLHQSAECKGIRPYLHLEGVDVHDRA